MALPGVAWAVPFSQLCVGKCVGDCNAGGSVTVNEVLTLVNVALGNAPISDCPGAEAMGIHDVTVRELVDAVVNALNGCPLQTRADVCACAPEQLATVSFGTSSLTTNVASRYTAEATKDPLDPQISCGCPDDSHTVWARLNPQNDGIATIDTAGSDYDTVVGAFTGACGAPAELACDRGGEGGSRIVFPVTAGTTYLVEVAAACGSDGGFLLLTYDLCGDGFASISEECDDGNRTDGDGCSSTCTKESLGGIDQSWTGPRDASCGVSQAVFSSGTGSSGQEFIPTRSDLAAVEVLVGDERVPGQPPTKYTLSIRAGTIDGPVVGTASALVTASGLLHEFWLQFAFDAPLSVTPGATYVIELRSPYQSSLWWYSFRDTDCSEVAGYPDGTGFFYGNRHADADWFFRIYGALR